MVGSPEPRPFRATLSFSGGFRLWSRHLLLFCGVTLVCLAPDLLQFHLGSMSPERSQRSPWEYLRNFVVVLLGSLPAAVLARCVYDELTGERPSLRKSLHALHSRIISVLGLILLGALGSSAGVLLTHQMDPDPRHFGVPGLLFLVMQALVGSAFWVSVPVAIVERKGVQAALLRSLELTTTHYPSVLALNLLLTLVTIGAGFLAMIPPCFLGDAGVTSSPASSRAPSPESVRHFAIAFQLVYVLYTSFSSVLTSVVYHDLRAAREGGTAPPAGAAATDPPAST